jgi:hypothetical protein
MTIGDMRAGMRQPRRRYMGASYSSDEIAAAVAVNDALNAHGYNVGDQPLYKAFQRAAGLTVDGFPGAVMMDNLHLVLQAAGVTPADVPSYPWKSTGSYDGVNAPLLSEWRASPQAQASADASDGSPVLVLPEVTIVGHPAGNGAAAVHPAATATHAWLKPTLIAGGAAGVLYLGYRALKKRRKGRRDAGALAILTA